MALVLIISIQIFKPKLNHTFINEESYPVKACDYIIENLDIENIRLYNEYNYGSYLIFRGIPVFIDSRADLYAPEFNEGITVFNDFIELSGLNLREVSEKIDEYGITHLMMYSKAKLRIFLESNEDKYELLYDDDVFCIYERIYESNLQEEGQEL